MRHQSSKRKQQIDAEVQARREAALTKARAMRDCPDCIREEQPGETRLHDCGNH